MEEGRAEVVAQPPPREAPEKVAGALAFCKELLWRIGAQVNLEMQETPEAIGMSLKPRDGNEVEVTGQLVEAIQYLVNRVVNPRAEGRKWVNLDLGGFRELSDPAMEAMARRLADVARRSGKVLAVAPISPRERRQIHLALVDVEGIATRSEGEGLFRRLLIIPSPAGSVPGASVQ